MSNLSPMVDSYYAAPGTGPKSPRHYNKFTYAAMRKPENEADEIEPVSPRTQRKNRGELTDYEALVAGLAPLRYTEDGFCIAEDGAVSSRFVCPTRHSAPAIAMVGVPVTVIPTRRSGNGPTSAVAYISPSRAHNGTYLSPNAQPIIRHVSDIDPAPQHEVDTWNKFVMLCQDDFGESELVDMSWEVIERLLGHYRMINPIEIARVQLMWKRKHAVLPSDTMSQVSSVGIPAGGYPISGAPSNQSYSNNSGYERMNDSRSSMGGQSEGRGTDSSGVYIPAAMTRNIKNVTSMSIGYQTQPQHSPRRSQQRYVPGHRQKTDYSHVTSKIDNGRGNNTPTRASSRASSRPGTPRAATPVRNSPGASFGGKASPSPMKF